MASPMGPPQPAGYSLRVQLFGPTAYDATDKPIRCFRVVASPDYTVEEFCVEASRIHEINYGQPLTLKKVQDDQQFDITQSEVVGNLFSTASTIRFVQASAIPGREDSVAPNSALRFDPYASRKRGREGSSRVNGSTPANVWKPNKRQRVADPDEPLPSRENEDVTRETLMTNGRILDSNIIPNSQESIILGKANGHFHNSRNVRTAHTSIPRTVREVAETPPPSPPPPALLRSPFDDYGSADHQMNQHDLDEDSNVPSRRAHSSPLGEATARTQSDGSNPRAKSYHIQRASERGTSVSTAATSPLSVDQRPLQNGTTSASQRRRPESRLVDRERNGKLDLSHDEISIYENIATDDEEFGLASIARDRKASLKARNSPSGLPALDWIKNKFNTPPGGTRRSSAAREQTAPGELPLTPNSKEREERQKQKQQTDEARKTRLAAAETRQAEETHQAETERAKREEQERIEVEEFQRGEAERKAAITRASRAEKEREAQEKREDEERRRDGARFSRLEKEKAVEGDRLEEERLAHEKSAAEEAERLRKEEEIAAATLKRKQKRSIPEESRQYKSASPVLPKSRGGTPGSSSRVQSATPFIPGQRKSALKRTASSQAMRSSSPAGSKASTDDSSNGVSIELQMPLSKPHNRRVSFRDEPEQNPTPIRPASRILPPKFPTPKSMINSSTPKASPTVTTPNNSTQKPVGLASKAVIAPGSAPRSSQSTILPPAKTSTPILPPGRSVARSSLGQSITPVQFKITQAPKEPIPETAKKVSPVPTPAARKSTTPIPAPKGKSKSVEPTPKEPFEAEVSSDDSEEEIRSRPSPRKRTPSKPATKSAIAADSSDDEDETQSHNSSPRDSRSPVIFSQHPRSTDTIKAHHSAPPESESNSESEADEDDEDQVEEDFDTENEPKSTPGNKFLDDEAEDGSSSSGSEEEEEEEEGEDVDEEDEDDDVAEIEVPNSSLPVLPQHKHQASPKPAGSNSSKDSLSDEEHNTQDEIDQQLTSSLYEAHSIVPASSALVYPPTSSAAPRPSMKIGVSLSSLNRNKSMLATSSATKPVVSRSGQRTLQSIIDDEDSEESEEESDNDSSDSFDSEAPKLTQKDKSPTRRDDSSDSDSSGNSDLDSEVDEQKKIRDELALEIAGLKGSDNANLLSPKLYKTSTQQCENSKERKKKVEKKTDKFLTGYKFNTSF